MMTVALDFAIPRTTGAKPFWLAGHIVISIQTRAANLRTVENIARRPRITNHNLAS